MKQSAVEFLEKEITEIMSYLEEDGFYAMQGVKDKLFGEKNIIQQATLHHHLVRSTFP